MSKSNFITIMIAVFYFVVVFPSARAGVDTPMTKTELVQCITYEIEAGKILTEIEAYRKIVARNIVEMDKTILSMKKYKGRKKFTKAEEKEIRHAMAVIRIGNDSISTLLVMQSKFVSATNSLTTVCNNRNTETAIMLKVCSNNEYIKTKVCETLNKGKPDVQIPN